jgi:hypothetical protein
MNVKAEREVIRYCELAAKTRSYFSGGEEFTGA